MALEYYSRSLAVPVPDVDTVVFRTGGDKVLPRPAEAGEYHVITVFAAAIAFHQRTRLDVPQMQTLILGGHQQALLIGVHAKVDQSCSLCDQRVVPHIVEGVARIL